MKQTKNTFSVLIMLLFFLGTSLSAQEIQRITPSNALRSAKEIKDLFGDKIEVSPSEIEAFYLQQWNEEYPFNDNCEAPKAKLKDINNKDVTFKWNSTDNQNGRYIVSYLRLSNGDSETIITSETTTTVETPNDLYLFVFQSQCASFASALDIIIIEKPLDFVEKNCNCPRYDLIWYSQFSEPLPLVGHTWGVFNTTKSYYAEVNINDGPSASFRANIIFGPSGPEIVGLSPECMYNVELSTDGTFVYMHEPGDQSLILGVFGFFSNTTSFYGPPQFSFNFTTYGISNYDFGKVYLNKCRAKPRNETEDQLAGTAAPYIKSRSNPIQTHTTIEYYLPTTEKIQLSIFDAYGKQVQILKNQELVDAGIHQLTIDLSDLPNGMYLCVLKSQSNILPLKLMKTY